MHWTDGTVHYNEGHPYENVRMNTNVFSWLWLRKTILIMKRIILLLYFTR
jgi:hypothetical protein